VLLLMLMELRLGMQHLRHLRHLQHLQRRPLNPRNPLQKKPKPKPRQFGRRTQTRFGG
jgi:hypothetical protein